jgi:uncharacterized membrane-anchored protein
MNRRRAPSLAGFACLAALQLGIPVSMLVSRANALRSGTEVKLAVMPRDPRSLTRGDYSELNYTIAHFDKVALHMVPPCADKSPCLMNGLPVYVTLAPNADGVAQAGTIDLVPPPAGTLFIQGKVSYGSYDPKCPQGGCFTGTVTYGIEQWFGPQGVPAQVDRARAGSLTAMVRLASDGTAVLASLFVDGKLVGEE